MSEKIGTLKYERSLQNATVTVSVVGVNPSPFIAAICKAVPLLSSVAKLNANEDKWGVVACGADEFLMNQFRCISVSDYETVKSELNNIYQTYTEREK